MSRLTEYHFATFETPPPPNSKFLSDDEPSGGGTSTKAAAPYVVRQYNDGWYIVDNRTGAKVGGPYQTQGIATTAMEGGGPIGGQIFGGQYVPGDVGEAPEEKKDEKPFTGSYAFQGNLSIDKYGGAVYLTDPTTGERTMVMGPIAADNLTDASRFSLTSRNGVPVVLDSNTGRIIPVSGGASLGAEGEGPAEAPKTREQIQQENRDARDALNQQLLTAAKDYAAANPDYVARGTRVENVKTGLSYEMTYNDKYGAELTPVKGNTSEIDPYGVGAVKAQGLKTSGYTPPSVQTVAELLLGGGSAIARAFPGASPTEYPELLGVNSWAPSAAVAMKNSRTHGVNSAQQYDQVYAHFTRLGMSPEAADRQAQIFVAKTKIANAAKPERLLNEFGQPVDEDGNVTTGSPEINLASYGSERGVQTVQNANGTWSYVINGKKYGNYETAEEAAFQGGLFTYHQNQFKREAEIEQIDQYGSNASLSMTEPIASTDPNRISQNPRPAMPTPTFPVPGNGGGGTVPPAPPPPDPIQPYNGPVIYQPPFPTTAGTPTPTTTTPEAAGNIFSTAPLPPAPAPMNVDPIVPLRRRRRRSPLDELEAIVA